MARLVLLLLLLPLAAHANPSPIALCRAAIATAEREHGLPPGLLAAIGRVESSRRDPATGETGPWPWTINAEGAGRHFQSQPEAVAHVRQLQAGGMRSIDIGCMQINQRHHPNAFASLEEGFDPLANARYAARFLKSLYEARGDWMAAAGAYHSNTPSRAELYRAQVALRWPEEQRRAAAAPGWNAAWANLARPAAPTAPAVNPTFPGLAGLGLSTRGGGGGMPTVIRTAGAAEGERGRGLDSYRAMAIPLASRAPAMLMRVPLAGRG